MLEVQIHRAETGVRVTAREYSRDGEPGNDAGRSDKESEELLCGAYADVLDVMTRNLYGCAFRASQFERLEETVDR